MALIFPGDFACVPMAGPPGELVRAGQWLDGDGFQDYQHALIYAGQFVRTPDPSLRDGKPVTIIGSGSGPYVIEAMPGGARLRKLDCPPEDYPGALWSTGHITLTGAQRAMVTAAAWAYLRTPYSAADYFALAAHRLRLHPADNMLKNYIASTRHMICSQYVDRCYWDGSYHLFSDDRWPGYVTPLDLAHVIEAA